MELFSFEILPCFYDHDREGDMEKDHQIENWHCSIFGSGKMGGQHPKGEVFLLFPSYSLTSCMCFVYGSVITLSSGIWTIAILWLESWSRILFLQIVAHLKHNEIFVPKLNFAKNYNLLALAQTLLMLWNYGLSLLHILFLPLQDMLQIPSFIYFPLAVLCPLVTSTHNSTDKCATQPIHTKFDEVCPMNFQSLIVL